MERLQELNQVQTTAITRLWDEHGILYSARQRLSDQQVAAVLNASDPTEEYNAGTACAESLAGAEVAQTHTGPAGLGKLWKILKKLLQFEGEQIAAEDEILAGLRWSDEFMQKLPQLDLAPYFIVQVNPLTEAVARLSRVQQLVTTHIINRWTFLHLNDPPGVAWVWPSCNKIGQILNGIVSHALTLFRFATAHPELCAHSVASLDILLQHIFNETFLIRTHSKRFLVYTQEEKSANAEVTVPTMEFHHLLHPWFVPETEPMLSLVNREQLYQVMGCPSKVDGSLSCADGFKNVGCVILKNPGQGAEEGADVDNEAPIMVKFEKVLLRRGEREQGHLYADKLLVCEMNVFVDGWRIAKLTATSLPLVFGSRSDQESEKSKYRARAAIQFADAAFRFNGHSDGVADARVTVSKEKLLESLNRYKMSRMGSPLTWLNWECLSNTLLRVCVGGSVTLDQFVRQPMSSEGLFTFSEFFYGFLLLGEQYFDQMWKDGLVLGWVERERVDILLRGSPVGTILIRAASSEKGVTVSWKHSDSRVYSLSPWSEQHLRIKSLVQRIDNVAPQVQLSWVYPNHQLEILQDPRYSAAARVPSSAVQVGPVIRRYAPMEDRPVVLLSLLFPGGSTGHI